MISDNVNKWLSAIANLAVLAGIVMVGLELRETNRLAKYEVLSSNLANFDELNSAFSENEQLLDLAVILSDESSELTPRQAIQAKYLVIRMVNKWKSAEIAFDNGFTSQHGINLTLDDIDRTFHEFQKLRKIFMELLSDYIQNKKSPIEYKIR
jgi:hypothetical protein